MRILRINGYDVDIDEKTAIGITFQTYDIKNPGERKVKLSNTFNIPLTANNRKIIGFAENNQTLSNLIYGEFTCDYWLDNIKLIDHGRLRITNISNRINFYLTEKRTFWDELKVYNYSTFVVDFLAWLNQEKNIPIFTDPYPGEFNDFMNIYANKTDGLIIPYYLGNLYNYEPGGEGTGFLEDTENLYSFYLGSGSHVCAYVITIFEFFQSKYDVDFLLNSTDTNIIWNDEFAPKIYIPIREYYVDGNGALNEDFCFSIVTTETKFKPYSDVEDKPDKTMYDFVKSWMQLFNIIIDEEIIGDILYVKMYRFDDIKDNADVVSFSGNIDLTKIKFTPSIDGFEQNSRIKYSKVYSGANEYEGSKTVICNNKNLEKVTDLFTFDCYYPNVVLNVDSEAVINLSPEESFETFVFLISDGQTINNKNFKVSILTWSGKMQLSAIYDITNEYTFIDEIVAYPKYYEIEKWLKLSDIINLQFFKQYYIQELGGSYFINKISGFNPEKSNKPTKLEVFKVSDKVPKPVDVYLESFYVDGVENAFVDADGNYFV